MCKSVERRSQPRTYCTSTTTTALIVYGLFDCTRIQQDVTRWEDAVTVHLQLIGCLPRIVLRCLRRDTESFFESWIFKVDFLMSACDFFVNILESQLAPFPADYVSGRYPNGCTGPRTTLWKSFWAGILGINKDVRVLSGTTRHETFALVLCDFWATTEIHS